MLWFAMVALILFPGKVSKTPGHMEFGMKPWWWCLWEAHRATQRTCSVCEVRANEMDELPH